MKMKLLQKKGSSLAALCCLISGLLAVDSAQAFVHVFQQGAETTVDSIGTGVTYTGTQDIYLDGPNANGNNTSQFLFSGSVPLIRFDDIFGPGPGQIPIGSLITSATLELGLHYLAGVPVGRYGEIHADQPWDEATATTASVLGGNGLQFGVDSDLLGSFNSYATLSTLDVTSSLTARSTDPSQNNGWGLKRDNGGNTGWRSSEYGIIANRPVLSVTYAAVPEPSSTALLGLGGLALMLRRRR